MLKKKSFVCAKKKSKSHRQANHLPTIYKLTRVSQSYACRQVHDFIPTYIAEISLNEIS